MAGGSRGGYFPDSVIDSNVTVACQWMRWYSYSVGRPTILASSLVYTKQLLLRTLTKQPNPSHVCDLHNGEPKVTAGDR